MDLDTSETPNKSLQPTRDGALSSASRCTSFGPARLSPGHRCRRMRARFKPAVFVVLMSCCCLFGVSGRAESPSEKPVIYREVKSSSNAQVDEALRRAYASKFRVVSVRPQGGFVRSICTRRLVPRPHYDSRGRLIAGFVRVGFVITSAGQITQPVTLSSTNGALDPIVYQTMQTWRSTPARFKGKPVPCLEFQDFTFRQR